MLVGVNFAKGLAFAWKKPLYAISHIKGHIASNYIDSTLTPPYLCMLASGGHTAVVHVKNYTDIELVASSRDDAAGEAFDKVARVLGLPYPGGPEIEKLALEGKPSINMPAPKFKRGEAPYFSYSGLKTFVINYVHNLTQKGKEIPRADVACSFQKAAIDQMVTVTGIALEKTGLKKVSIAGGVSANKHLRASFEKFSEKGVEVHYPKLQYCTDNASMIGAAAYFMIEEGLAPTTLDLDAKATVPLK